MLIIDSRTKHIHLRRYPTEMTRKELFKVARKNKGGELARGSYQIRTSGKFDDKPFESRRAINIQLVFPSAMSRIDELSNAFQVVLFSIRDNNGKSTAGTKKQRIPLWMDVYGLDFIDKQFRLRPKVYRNRQQVFEPKSLVANVDFAVSLEKMLMPEGAQDVSGQIMKGLEKLFSGWLNWAMKVKLKHPIDTKAELDNPAQS